MAARLSGCAAMGLQPSVRHLQFNGEEFKIAVFVHELSHASQMLVCVPNNVQDWDELPQTHWKVSSHPAFTTHLPGLFCCFFVFCCC